MKNVLRHVIVNDNYRPMMVMVVMMMPMVPVMFMMSADNPGLIRIRNRRKIGKDRPEQDEEQQFFHDAKVDSFFCIHRKK
jgi:hypothetical protein